MRRQTRKAFHATLLALAALHASASNGAAQTQPTPAPAPAAAATDTGGVRDERLWRKALKIHGKAIIVDGHNDITEIMVDERYDLATPSVGKYHTDLARLKQSGMTGQFFSVYVDRKYASPEHASGKYLVEGGSARRALDLIDVVYRMAEKYPADLSMAYSTDDIRRAKKQGKVGALMGIGGGHAIENSLSVLREFHRLGVRYMTLTHNNTNEWADACCDAPRHGGLSDFGREVVREMNRLGMIVDVSHVSDETMSDVLDMTAAPVIASHSSARALANHKRNIPDELLKRIAQNRGVVMINFYPAFINEQVRLAVVAREERLKPERDRLSELYKNDPARLAAERKRLDDANPLNPPPTPLSVLVDHIDHVRKVAGVDYVGLGSDFDGVPFLPQEMEDVTKLSNITYELLKRGYTEDEVRKVLGGNLMRAFAEVERVARSRSRTISGEGSMRRLEDPAGREGQNR